MSMLAQKIAPVQSAGLRRRRKVGERQSGVTHSESMTNTEKVSDILVRMGCISKADVSRIEALQRKTGEPFGRVAIKLKIASPTDVCAAAGVQNGYLLEVKSPAAIPRELVLVRRRMSAQAEQYRRIVTNLVTSTDAARLKCFSVIAADREENSANIEANIATAFAQLGRRVLLVDTDFNQNPLGKYFGLRPSAIGLGDVLAGGKSLEDSVAKSIVKNLSLMPSGSVQKDANELLGTQTFAKLLADAKLSYDIIMVMTPPFGRSSSSAQFVWAATDGALVNVKRNVARTGDLKQLSGLLHRLEVEIIGAVMVA